MREFTQENDLPPRLHRIIDWWVKATPDAVALQDDFDRLTYGKELLSERASAGEYGPPARPVLRPRRMTGP